jgi:thiol-disulfide isomerase/thioredoxin
MSVVTKERFEQGLLYSDYISGINVNKDRFELYYETSAEAVDSEAVEFFKGIVESGVNKVLVIGEDWCPDVFRGMPLMARIAEVSGMEMRVFPRDSHLDIMNEFLKDGEHQSIPVFVFYNNDHEYIAHWAERPEFATDEMAKIRENVLKDNDGSDEKEIRRASRDQTVARFPYWQKVTVGDLKELLSKNIDIT